MSFIEEVNLKIAELYQELHQIEKAGYSPENIKRLDAIKKQTNELKIAIRMRQRQLGLRESV